MAPRPAVVHVERPDRHSRSGSDQLLRGRQRHLVAHRDHRRRPGRHAVHGVPLGAGSAARPAADDPVAAPVRLPRRAPRVGVRLPAVRRLQRLQHHPGRAGPELDGPWRGQALGGDRDHPRVRHRAGRLRPDPQGGAVPHLRHRRHRRHLHGRRPDAALPGRLVRPVRLQVDAVPRPVRRRGRLPDQLGHLRFRLLALPAAQRDRPQDVLLDLLGVGHRRRLDDDPRRAPGRLGRGQVRRHRDLRDPAGRQQGLRRLRRHRPGAVRGRPDLGHRPQHVRRVADPHQCHRLVQPGQTDHDRCGW